MRTENEPDLFAYHPPNGYQLKDMAQRRVLENDTEKWKEDALHVIMVVAATMREFTADDVRNEAFSQLLPEPHHPGAWGAIMRIASLRGFMVKTGSYKPSGIPSLHARPQAVWRSKIYQE